MPNRRAKVIRKSSAVDIITWRSPTARLLPRLLKGRRNGPEFVTGRRARVALPPGDVDSENGRARLSYRQAAAIFEEATRAYPGGPWTLHQLRHSALTHAAEDGASTSTLLAYSGHTSVASLARCPGVARGAGPLAGAARPGAAFKGVDETGSARWRLSPGTVGTSRCAHAEFDAHPGPLPPPSAPSVARESPPPPPPRPLADLQNYRCPAYHATLRCVPGGGTGSLALTSSPGDAADFSSRTPPGIRIQRTLFASRNVRIVRERASLDVKSRLA